MPCKHADKMMIYAKQAAEMDEPWKLWQWRSDCGGWNRFDGHFAFHDCYQYRQLPKTIRIGNHDIPEPMREKPDIGAKYWYVDIDELRQWTTWQDDEYDNNRFKNGVCHATQEAAMSHAKALFSFTESNHAK